MPNVFYSSLACLSDAAWLAVCQTCLIRRHGLRIIYFERYFPCARRDEVCKYKEFILVETRRLVFCSSVSLLPTDPVLRHATFLAPHLCIVLAACVTGGAEFLFSCKVRKAPPLVLSFLNDRPRPLVSLLRLSQAPHDFVSLASPGRNPARCLP